MPATNCLKCGKCYEEQSEEQANSPARECMDCWMKAHTEENVRIYQPVLRSDSQIKQQEER